MQHMPEVVGVRFRPCGKIYDFELDGATLRKGDLVVVESELGLNLGTVVMEPYAVEDHEKKLKKIIRKATDEDLLQREENRKLESEAKENCLERIMARGLPMKLICTESTLDRKRIIFYFTADKRIDFRELVKDLASRFKTRIEMRQIGVRDSARVIGSLGICGRELCCARFLTSFEPISIKMAKKQELVLNTNKLSGSCGRLMCCLGFEYAEASLENHRAADRVEVGRPEEESAVMAASGEPFQETSGPAPQPVAVTTVNSRNQSPTAPSDKKEKRGKRRKWYPRRRKNKTRNE